MKPNRTKPTERDEVYHATRREVENTDSRRGGRDSTQSPDPLWNRLKGREKR